MGRHDDAKTVLDLVNRAQGGDHPAFQALIELYEPSWRVLARRGLGPKLGKRVEVDDVLQEAYLRAFKSLHQFEWRNDDSFVHWVGGIVEHVLQQWARKYLQTKKRAGVREFPLVVGKRADSEEAPNLTGLLWARGPTPSKVMLREERFQRLEAALRCLKKEYREVILARLQGLVLKDIAVRMGRSTDAVSMLFLRALRQLKEHFGHTDSLTLPARSLDIESRGSGSCDKAGASRDRFGGVPPGSSKSSRV